MLHPLQLMYNTHRGTIAKSHVNLYQNVCSQRDTWENERVKIFIVRESMASESFRMISVAL